MPPMHRGYSAGAGPDDEGREWFMIGILAMFYGPLAALGGLIIGAMLSAFGVPAIVIGFMVGFFGTLVAANKLGAFN